MEKIHELKSKMKEMCEMKECLMRAAKTECDKGLESVDTEEMGKVVDMIKDLAEAEKFCWESLYYETVVQAMKEAEEDDEMNERMGYNSRHYASGRFAPSGRGHMVSGYMPTHVDYQRMGFTGYGDSTTGMGMNGRPGAMEGAMDGSRGYSGSNGGGSSSSGNSGSNGSSGYTQEYGRPYNQYIQSRRHYTETKDPSSKDHMDHHAKEHLEQTLMTVREIWHDADPTMKKKMKMDLTTLVGEMNV